MKNYDYIENMWSKFHIYKIYFFFNIYRKILIPGLIFVQMAFLLGLFLGELVFGGAYYWKEFCVSKWVGLDNKNSLKQLALTGYGLIFGRPYYWKGF